MVGRMYVNAPVSSNMITTIVTVNLVTPLLVRFVDTRAAGFSHPRAAAAPRKA
jgi:hypothetical protein